MAAEHKSQYLRVLSQRALARFDLAYARQFGEAKGGFNAAQPRVPAGNPDGGQWTSGGGDSRNVRKSAARIAVLAKSLPSHVVIRAVPARTLEQ